ncbi:MAG TPA: hypothetical protein VM911_03405 [Pyrinomonadaceae bacterium]|nr:hypothetical protein [Pyrinomonadaceae bacterium]
MMIYRIGLFVLTLSLFLTLAASRSPGQVKSRGRVEVSSRSLRLDWGQYARPGYKSIPVEIIRFQSEPLPEKKYLIKVAELKNRSSKAVRAVKFSWYLYNKKNLNEVLQTEQTPLVNLYRLAPRSKLEVSIPLLRPDQIQYLRQDVATGEFSLEIAVTEIQYEDGSVWEAKNLPSNVDLSRIKR